MLSVSTTRDRRLVCGHARRAPSWLPTHALHPTSAGAASEASRPAPSCQTAACSTHASCARPPRPRNDAARTQTMPQALHCVTSLGSGSLRTRARDRWLRLASNESRDVCCAGPEPRGRCPGRAGEAPCRLRARPAIAPLLSASASMRASAGPSVAECFRQYLCTRRAASDAQAADSTWRVLACLFASRAPSMGWPVVRAAAAVRESSAAGRQQRCCRAAGARAWLLRDPTGTERG